MSDIKIQTFSRQGIHVALGVRKNKITSIRFSLDSVDDAVNRACESLGRTNFAQMDASNEIRQWASEIHSAIQGKPVKYTLRLDIASLPAFTKHVLNKVQDIPRGYVASYRAVATAAGNRDAMRAVGNAMARNPFAIAVPCHRVVKSDLTIGQYGYGPSVKRRLLELEGVKFEKNAAGVEHVSSISNYRF